MSPSQTLYSPGYLPARYYSGSAGRESPCQNNLASLYAFGPTYWDSSANSDDGVVKLTVSGAPLAFFGVKTYSVVCVFANGAVILKTPGSSCSSGYYSAIPGPVYGSLGPGVLLFWKDIDSATPLGTNGYPSAVQNTQYSAWNGESVTSHAVNDTLAPPFAVRVSSPPAAADASRMAADVALAFPSEPAFSPATVLVVTFYAVGYCCSFQDKLNTFQLAMGSDAGGRTFASICYDNLLWLYASDGAAVLPVAAFTDGVSSSVLLSGADSAATFLNMTCGGTAGLSNGCQIFRVDATPVAGVSLSQTPTASATQTASVSSTASVTSSRTGSLTGTKSQTASRTRTASQTTSQSSTQSRTRSSTPSITQSSTRSASGSPTLTQSTTPSQAWTPSVTATQTVSTDLTRTITPTQARTPSATASSTPSESSTPSPTTSPSLTATQSCSGSPSSSGTPSGTPTGSGSASQSGSATGSESSTPSPSASASVSGSPSETVTRTPSLTATLTISPSVSATASQSVSTTPSGSPTPSPSGTPSGTASQSASQSPSESMTPSWTPSNSPTPSVTPSYSRTASTTPTPLPGYFPATCIVTAAGPVNIEGGLATGLQLWAPYAAAPDGLGGAWIVDMTASAVRHLWSNGTLSTSAGAMRVFSYSGDGGPAALARLNNPTGICADGAGGYYVADRNTNVIRRVTASGTISLFSGLPGGAGYSGDRGPATSARMYYPTAVAPDGAGGLYTVELYSNSVRRIFSNGTIVGVVGNNCQNFSNYGFAGDGGPATNALLNRPQGVSSDGFGGVLVADTGNNVIRRAFANGTIIITAVGTPLTPGFVDRVAATAARLYQPTCVALDPTGRWLIADRLNCVIRVVDPTTMLISTLVGIAGLCGYNGDGILASSAYLSYPFHVAIDGLGGLLISDTNNYALRYVAPSGLIFSVAGIPATAPGQSSGDGGTGVVRFNTPATLLPDGYGGVLIADQSNWRGRLLDNSSTTSTVMFPGAPGSIVSDGAGGLLIGDIGSHTVRRARRNAGGSYTVTSIAGNGTVGFAGDSGFASAALLYQPFGVAPDGSGGVYVADFQNCAVRRISAAGNISTVVGAGPLIPGRTTNCGNSGVGGPGTDARIGGPRNIVSDGFGGALFSDPSNRRIRRIASGGTLTNVLTSFTFSTSPLGLASDGAAGYLISDAGYCNVKDYLRNVTAIHVAGSASNICGYSGDGGPPTSALLSSPYHAVPDSSTGPGGYWIADTGNQAIRRILPIAQCGQLGSLLGCVGFNLSAIICNLTGLSPAPPVFAWLGRVSVNSSCVALQLPSIASNGFASVMCPLPVYADVEYTGLLTWMTQFGTASAVTTFAVPTYSQTMSGSMSPSLTPTQTVSQTRTPSQTVSPSASGTPTVSPTMTQSRSQSATQSPSQTSSGTRTGSPTPSQTRTQTQTPSASQTVSQSQSSSMTGTPSSTVSPSSTQSSTRSATQSPSGTQSASVSRSQSASGTQSRSVTQTGSQMQTQSRSQSQSQSPSLTQTQSRSTNPTGSQTQSSSLSGTRSSTLTPSTSQSRSVTPTPSVSGTASSTATPSPSATGSVTVTQTPSESSTMSRSGTLTSSPSQTSSPSVSATSSESATLSASVSPSASATTSAVGTLSSSATPTPTLTPSVTGSPSSSGSASATASPSSSSTPSTSGSPSPTHSPSPSSTRSSTASPSSTATASESGSPSETPSATSSPSSSATPSGSATSSASGSRSQSQSRSATPSPSQSSTLTSSGTASPSGSPSGSASPSSSRTASVTVSLTRSSTQTPSGTATASSSASQTGTQSASSAATSSASRSRSGTRTPTRTPSQTFTGSGTASPSASGSGTQGPTPLASATSTGTSSGSSCATTSPSASPSQSASASATTSLSPSSSESPSHLPSSSETASLSASPSITPSQSMSPLWPNVTEAAANDAIAAALATTSGAVAIVGGLAALIAVTLLVVVLIRQCQTQRTQRRLAPGHGEGAGGGTAVAGGGAAAVSLAPHRILVVGDGRGGAPKSAKALRRARREAAHRRALQAARSPPQRRSSPHSGSDSDRSGGSGGGSDGGEGGEVLGVGAGRSSSGVMQQHQQPGLASLPAASSEAPPPPASVPLQWTPSPALADRGRGDDYGGEPPPAAVPPPLGGLTRRQASPARSAVPPLPLPLPLPPSRGPSPSSRSPTRVVIVPVLALPPPEPEPEPAPAAAAPASVRLLPPRGGALYLLPPTNAAAAAAGPAPRTGGSSARYTGERGSSALAGSPYGGASSTTPQDPSSGGSAVRHAFDAGGPPGLVISDETDRDASDAAPISTAVRDPPFAASALGTLPQKGFSLAGGARSLPLLLFLPPPEPAVALDTPASESIFMAARAAIARRFGGGGGGASLGVRRAALVGVRPTIGPLSAPAAAAPALLRQRSAPVLGGAPAATAGGAPQASPGRRPRQRDPTASPTPHAAGERLRRAGSEGRGLAAGAATRLPPPAAPAPATLRPLLPNAAAWSLASPPPGAAAGAMLRQAPSLRRGAQEAVSPSDAAAPAAPFDSRWRR